MAQEQKTERVHKFQFLGKFIIKGILECVTGTRIGGTQERFEIGGIDNPVIKDPLTDLPYIPGSSLKGKLRSLLEWARDLDAVKQPNREHSREREVFTACWCGEPNCVSCRLFGVASNEESKRRNVGPTRLTVRDAFPTGYEAVLEAVKQGKELRAEDLPKDKTVRRWWETLGEGINTELKSENFINRLTAEANPRTMERVPAGSEFQVEFVMDVYDANGDKDLLEALAEAMKLLEHSALGGSGSRGYGRVRFKGLKVEWFPVTYYRTGKGKQCCDVGTVDKLREKVGELWEWVGSAAKGSEG
jgi:CRISPR-associated protein Csm3